MLKYKNGDKMRVNDSAHPLNNKPGIIQLVHNNVAPNNLPYLVRVDDCATWFNEDQLVASGARRTWDAISGEGVRC